jgi:hypothetical protein
MPVTSKTALFSQKQRGGLFSIEDQSLSTGSRFFVHSGTGTDGAGYGRNPESPFATIDYAIAFCTADKNDIIYVMPGHAEAISAAADIALDIAGISVIGLGNGSNRPTVTFDTADTTDIDIDAANVTIENIIFSANYPDIAIAIDVNADDFTLKRCHFQATAVDMNFKICVQDAAATASDRISIIECTSHMLDAVDTHFINLAGTGDGHMINDNILHGNWGTMCLGGAGVVTRCTILRNTIFNIATDADACINMAATATGICAFNACAAGHATQGVVPGDLGSIENSYELSTSDLSGILEPANA